MNSQSFSRQFDRPALRSQFHFQDTLLERVRQPSVVIPALLLLFTIFYHWLYSSPFSRRRQPAELLWDFAITILPARALYALDGWLNPPMFPVSKSMRPTSPRTYAAKSELLQRILRMDKQGGGIINGVAIVGRKGLSTLSSSTTFMKPNTSQPPGLGNYDNSCFQNSILQGLSSLKPLPSYLENAAGDGGDNDKTDHSGPASTLRGLIECLRDAENNGKTLWTPARLKSLDTWQQQDAQEYFSKLLDEIDKEVAKTAKDQYKPAGLESAADRDDTEDSQHSDDSGYQSLSFLSKIGSEMKDLRNPLEGLSAQRVACVQCGYSEGLSLIPFNCLTLNLGVGQMEHDIFEQLDAYTHLEFIEGVECAKCTLLKVQRLLKILIGRGKEVGGTYDSLREPISRLEAVEIALEEDDFEEKTLEEKCRISAKHRVSSTKTKQAVIARAPQSLAVHMNRSVFDERTGFMFKNLAAVRFPLTLDLGPWCVGSAGPPEMTMEGVLADDKRSTSESMGYKEHWLSDPRTSMIAGEKSTSRITGPLYELRAVITHQGQHENGHYVCYRKHPGQSQKLQDATGAQATSTEDTENKIQDEEKTIAETISSDNIISDNEENLWWRLSDESVWEVTEDQVLNQGGVFMLLYDCVEPNSILVPEACGAANVTTLPAEATCDEDLLPDPREANDFSEDGSEAETNIVMNDKKTAAPSGHSSPEDMHDVYRMILSRPLK